MEKEQETDLDMLARMMADGFSSIDKRFDAVDTRFDTVDKRFDRLEGRVYTLEQEVRTTNRRIDEVVIPVIDDHSHRIKDLELAR
jgi:hypothetical protein